MALKIYKKIKHGKVTMREGMCYEFRYTSYENDPQPLIFFINAIKGIHPNTGHQWRLIQGININYVPRGDRKKFINIWEDSVRKGNDISFTWKRIESRFPYIKFGIRRYMLKPTYYIRNVREIPIDDWEKEVVRAWHKDFSKSLKRIIASKFKKFFSGRRR